MEDLRREKGISILYLARGFLTWPKDPNKESEPNAPVLLAPLEIRRADAAGSDFKIRRVGDWEVNETLLMFLSEQFNVSLNQDIGTDSDGEPIDKPELVVQNLQAAIPRIDFSLTKQISLHVREAANGQGPPGQPRDALRA